MMLFFFFGMGLQEKYHPRFGHETCYTVIFGMIISLIVYAIKGKELQNTWKFSSNLFFDWFLPPIVLNAGFNMYKQKFFENLGNVGIFGVCVTFVCFGLYSYFSVWLLNYSPMMTNYYALNHDDPTID